MAKRVLIIGGYGNFGSYIARRLAKEADLQIIIAGRNLDKATKLAEDIGAEAVNLDIHHDLATHLTQIKPDIVIHTSGPFQEQDYHVAKCCINAGCHYIDLADGRNFVANITSLNDAAMKKGVSVISGASSVPCLTSALVDAYKDQFSSIENLDYGITTAQKTNRGLATTAAILGYTGKSFETIINGHPHKVYGWQNLHWRKYKTLGWRLLGNCDIPDLALFTARYPSLKTIRFYAGLEIPLLHIGLWGLSWLVRIGSIKNLSRIAPFMLKASYWFDAFGSADSGFHMVISGQGHNNQPKETCFELTARDGDGPYIPCMPAILLTQKLARGDLNMNGAQPCLGLISKDEYLGALSSLNISWYDNA